MDAVMGSRKRTRRTPPSPPRQRPAPPEPGRTEDHAVPPQRSRDVVAAARAAGCRVEYLEFEGEGHGFRQQANIVRGMQAELAFLGEVFGFDAGVHAARGASATRSPSSPEAS
jgi:hypothetical protein